MVVVGEGGLPGTRSRSGRPSVGGGPGSARDRSLPRGGGRRRRPSDAARPTVARLREPPVEHLGAGVLLRHRLLHRRIRPDQRRRDGVVRRRGPGVGRRTVAQLRRAVRRRAVLPGHRLRHHIHRRVHRSAVRRAQPNQASANCRHVTQTAYVAVW